MYFDRWCYSREVASNLEKLRQDIFIKEFKRFYNDIKTYLEEQKVENLQKHTAVMLIILQ